MIMNCSGSTVPLRVRIALVAAVLAAAFSSCANGGHSTEPDGSAGGAARERIVVDGVVYEAASAVARDSLRVGVTATNTAGTTRHLEFGACALSLALYRAAAREEPAAWDEDRLERVCVLYLAVRDLAPGESIQPREFVRTVAVPEILGDSLPSGSYFVTGRLTVNDRRLVLAAGSVDLRD